MAFNVGSVVAGLEVNASEFNLGMREAGESLENFTEAARDAGDESEGFWSRLTPTIDLLQLFKDGLSLVGDALSFVSDQFNRANDAFGEYESTLESLDVALSLRGLGQLSDDLVEFAQAMQDTTQHSRVTTLQVSKFLALAGVGQKDLERFTKVVLDFSAATGIEAATAATQFARTLSGGTSRALTQYMPEVTRLTKAQREAGEVFEMGARKMRGFSEALAGTNVALGARLANEITLAFSNIGEALDPIVDDALVVGRRAVAALAQGIKENQEGISVAFAALAERGYAAFLTFADLLKGFPNTVRTVFGAFSVFFESGKIGWGGLKAVADGFLNTLTYIPELLARISLAPALLIEQGLGLSALDDALSGMTKSLRAKIKEPIAEIAEGFKIAAKEAGGVTDEVDAAGDAASTFDKVLAGVVAAMKDGHAAAEGLANGVQQASNNLESGRSAADVLANRFAQMGLSAGAAKQELRDIYESLGKSAGAADKMSDRVSDVKGEAAQAEQIFGSWTDSIWSANAALQQTASSAAAAGAAAGGAFGTGGAGDAFGRHSGGTASFATGSAAETAATLAGLQGIANQATIGTSARSSSQFVLWQGLVAKLKGQLADESKAFADSIIGELAQQGIWDPAARNTYLQQRYDEARRLGTLPRGATYSSGSNRG